MPRPSARGATADRNRWSDALRVGAVFGIFEAITPAIGRAVGLALSRWIAAVDHWIAFVLLLGVGGHTIHAALRTPEGEDVRPKGNGSPLRLAATALATSIDATAVGVSLAVMQVDIIAACLVIGAITTVVAAPGVRIGRHVGDHVGRCAEILGGAAPIVIGGSIPFQHLTA